MASNFHGFGGDTVGHKHSIGMRETVMNSSLIPHSTSCGRNRTGGDGAASPAVGNPRAHNGVNNDN